METKNILNQAECTVNHRQEEYGEPSANLDKIAQLWSAYLGKQVTGLDVAHMMILLKVTRNLNYKRDNLVDIAGYAYCAELMVEPLEKKVKVDVTWGASYFGTKKLEDQEGNQIDA